MSAAPAGIDARAASATPPMTAPHFMESSTRPEDPWPQNHGTSKVLVVLPRSGCALPIAAATGIAGCETLYRRVWQFCPRARPVGQGRAAGVSRAEPGNSPPG